MPARAATLVLIVLAAAAACGPPPAATAPAASPRNVLLVTLDTLRADRLGRGFTPTLDRLAAHGLRFTEARSVVPLTLPAHASILTGQYPPAHGARLNGVPRQAGETLATRLKAAGYQTRAVVGAFVLDRRFGLEAGFDLYDDAVVRDPDATDVLQAERPANAVVERALAVLADTAATAPWLLWVHFYDAHAPYTPPPAALARAEGRPYDGEVAYVDGELGRLLAAVDARPDAARTAVVVVGDHGEGLGDHGESTHGMLLFESALRVPLIVRAPDLPPAVRTDAASLVDIAPTVLALAGQTATGPGRSLLAPPPASVETYAESDYPTVAGWTPQRALVRERWKLVLSTTPALFDLAADPAEQRDLAGTQPSLAEGMAARARALATSTAAPEPGTGLAPEAADRLRTLGYVAPGRTAPSANAPAIDPATAVGDWAAFESALADSTAGRAAQALPVLARLAHVHPESPVFASTYARVLAASGHAREALTQLRAAVARWPGDATLYHDLAVTARQAGLDAEALRAERAARTIDARHPAAANGEGLLLADSGHVDEAARAFDEAVRLDPTNAVYASNLGNARRALGDLEGAAAAYRRALERAPGLADAANGLGAVLVQQGRPGEAMAWLERAAADPNFVEAQLNLGIAAQEAGDAARAAAQYRKVLATAGAQPRERDAARTLLAQLERR